MKIIPFKKSYYEEVCEWWKEHGWEPLKENMLTTEGYVVEEDGTKIVCGWFVRTNSLTALLEWIVGNPKVESKKVYKALEMLESHICKIANESGYEMLLTFLEHINLKKFLNSKNWVDAEKKIDVYIKRVQ